jgi:hypothetical protein
MKVNVSVYCPEVMSVNGSLREVQEVAPYVLNIAVIDFTLRILAACRHDPREMRNQGMRSLDRWITR